MSRRKTITSLGHTANDFLPRVDPGDVARAGGDCVCPQCGKIYYRHPGDPYELDAEGHPFLNVLCDGRRVKL